MAGGMDEGVANLSAFCGQLATTNDHLHESNTELATQEQAFEDLVSAADDHLGGLAQEIEDQREQIDGAENEAQSALQALEAGARATADQKLAGIEERLQEAGEHTGERLQAAQDDLDSSFDSLESGGYDGLEEGVDDLDSALGDDRDAVDEGFDDLESAVDDAEEALSEARESVGEALDDVGEEAAELSQAVATATDGHVATWSTQQAGLEQDCQELQSRVASDYQAWTEAALEKGQELMESLLQAFQTTATGVAERASDPVEEAGTEADERVLPALSDEAGAENDVLDAGTQLADALDPLSDELVSSLAVVDEVDRLLNAIE